MKILLYWNKKLFLKNSREDTHKKKKLACSDNKQSKTSQSKHHSIT